MNFDRLISLGALALATIAILIDAVPYFVEIRKRGDELKPINFTFELNTEGEIFSEERWFIPPRGKGFFDFVNDTQKTISISRILCDFRTVNSIRYSHRCDLVGSEKYPIALQPGTAKRVHFQFKLPDPPRGRQILYRYIQECNPSTFSDYLWYLAKNYESNYWGQSADGSTIELEDFYSCGNRKDEPVMLSIYSHSSEPEAYRGPTDTPFITFSMKTNLGERNVGLYYVGVGGLGGF